METIERFLSTGSGSGDGSGDGSGSGDGDGYGSGSGSGDGSGYGYGSGSGSGIASFNRQAVYGIDGVQTIISRVKGDIAKGFILNADLSLQPCFIAKHGEFFAHGSTAQEAARDAELKALEESPIEDRIALFNDRFNRADKYPAFEFFAWHRTLTGSCEMGRTQFMRDKGIAMEDMFTVAEFIALTKDAYGGDVIQILANERANGRES